MPILPPIEVAVPGGTGLLTLVADEEEGRMICGIYHLEGTLHLPPKAWLRQMRSEMTKIENIAREAGCSEMRMGGRDWSRIFPDYEPMDTKDGLAPNLLRKRL